MKIGMLANTISGSTANALRTLSSAVNFKIRVNNHISISPSNVPKNLIYLLDQATKLRDTTIATIASLMSAGVMANITMYLSDQSNTNDYKIENFLEDSIDTSLIQPGICNSNLTLTIPEKFIRLKDWNVVLKLPVTVLSLNRGENQWGDSDLEACLIEKLDDAFKKFLNDVEKESNDYIVLLVIGGLLGIPVSIFGAIKLYEYCKERRLQKQNNEELLLINSSKNSFSKTSLFKTTDTLPESKDVENRSSLTDVRKPTIA